MTALPAPLARFAEAEHITPRLAGAAVPVLIALTFDAAEAAALLAHATGADDTDLDRPGEVCRDLARLCSTHAPQAALVEAALWDRLAAHARPFRHLSLAEVADFWRAQRDRLDPRTAAGLLWFTLLQGGLCGRRLAEQMADDCLFRGLRRPR